MVRSAAAITTAAAVLALAASTAMAGSAETVRSRPEGTDEVIFNPGMGLAFCHWSAPPQWMTGETCWVDEVSDHVYIRVMWKEVNPERGVFTIDESLLGRHIAAAREYGRRYSLRIMPNCLSGPDVEDVAPTWIYDTGVDYVMVDTSHGGQKFPVPWGEPYLAAMEGLPVRGILQNPGDSAQIYARALEGAPSYFNWYGIRSDQMQSESERERLRDFARKLGYRLTVTEVEHPAWVRVGRNRPSLLEARLVWRNDGVAYCHEDVQMRIAALHADGKVVCEARRWPRHPVNAWTPGAEVEEPVAFTLPPDCPARIQLALGLMTRDGRPVLPALKERRADGLCPLAWIDVNRSDFEQVVLWQQAGPDEWSLSEGMQMEEVADGGPDGGRCLRINGDDPSDSWNFARLPDLEAQPGGKYVLSGHIKVDRGDDDRPAYVKIDCNDAEGRQISHVQGGRPSGQRGADGSFGWTTFRLETVAPPGTRGLSIAVEKGSPAPNRTECRIAGLRVELVEMP